MTECTIWRPIKTAPKDGRRVLVYVPNDGIGVAERDGKFWLAAWGDYDWVDVGAVYTDLKSVTPTHWMPLPAPPEKAGSPGGQRPQSRG